jgi:acyl-coenzyme A thioesterase PaaI-like protein
MRSTDGSRMREAVLAADELERRLTVEFPELFNAESALHIEAVWHGGCRVRRGFHAGSLRPGGTISGPTLMMLADFSMYVALLASIGWVPLATTSSLTINFLSKPRPLALAAECRLLRIGRRLAVGEIGIRSDGHADLVAHATSTYAIPAKASGAG